ncbi:MAG: PH domain-containing protein [Mobilicoccus sp.]|nr:PH domain-containing protein [Mobilicoccus sp.]
MSNPRPSQDPMAEEAEDKLGKYLTQGEHIVIATHRHWFAVAEPIATATLSLLLIGALFIAGGPSRLVEVLLLAWLIAFGRAIIRVIEWNLEWFVATDQRLLLIYGFIIRKVDMLPMSKVTDMTFRRSIVGRIFGYGKFVLESAGQEQALSDLHFIPDPNENYLKIVQTIFKTGPDPEDGEVLPEGINGIDPEVGTPESEAEIGSRPSVGRSRDVYWEQWDSKRDDGTGPEEEQQPRRRSKDRRRDESDEWDDWDGWEEDDPTARPSLRADIARLERKRYHEESPDTASFALGAVSEGNPVRDRRRGKKRKPKPSSDYAETLYSTRGEDDYDPWDEDDHGPHRKKRSRWFG